MARKKALAGHDNVLGRFQQCYAELRVRNVIDFMFPEPTEREADVTECSTCHLNYLLFTVARFAIILEK